MPKELANPQRILLIRFGTPAEMFRSVPMLTALRLRFPYADIGCLLGEKAAALLADHWAVNRLFIVQNVWHKSLAEIRQLRHRLRLFAPQVVIDPMSSKGSAFAAWLTGARYRIGFGGKESRLLHNLHVSSTESAEILRNMELLTPFGIFGGSIDFDLPECEKHRQTAQYILHSKGLTGNFAMMRVGAEKAAQCWQAERFGQTAKYLLDQWNLPTLAVWSGMGEEKLAGTAVHTSNGAAIQAPWTTLAERASLLREAVLFIGSDTPELQIAAAVGTQCVGLFGAESELTKMPIGGGHRSVCAVRKPESKWRRRRKEANQLEHILPEHVYEQCDALLAEMLEPKTLPMMMQRERKKAA